MLSLKKYVGLAILCSVLFTFLIAVQVRVYFRSFFQRIPPACRNDLTHSERSNNNTPRFCDVGAPLNLNGTITLLSGSNLRVGYQCAGNEYDVCAGKAALVKATRNMAVSILPQPFRWGKRGYPLYLPNTSILFLGNSHTRQILEALLCQFNDDIVSLNETSWRQKIEVNLKHNITVFSSINSVNHYTFQWKERVTEELGRSFDSFDAIIFGQFNSINHAWPKSFWEIMQRDADARNFSLIGNVLDAGPDLREFASVYQGTIVATTSVGKDAEEAAIQMQSISDHLNTTSGRHNIAVLSGSAYIKEIGECAHFAPPEIVSVATIVQTPIRHRCIGGRGGHPDLLAWDVLAALYGLHELRMKSEKSSVAS